MFGSRDSLLGSHLLICLLLYTLCVLLKWSLLVHLGLLLVTGTLYDLIWIRLLRLRLWGATHKSAITHIGPIDYLLILQAACLDYMLLMVAAMTVRIIVGVWKSAADILLTRFDHFLHRKFEGFIIIWTLTEHRFIYGRIWVKIQIIKVISGTFVTLILNWMKFVTLRAFFSCQIVVIVSIWLLFVALKRSDLFLEGITSLRRLFLDMREFWYRLAIVIFTWLL